MPKVSMIVPVFNAPEAYFRHCVESMLAQTLTDVEIILVDDGSTDDSGAICDEYAARDARVKAIHQENGNVSVARNTGLRAATGEYIVFNDNDDWIEPEMCQMMVDAFEGHDVQLVFCAYKLIRGKQGDITSRVREADCLVSGTTTLQALMLYNLDGVKKQPYFNMIGTPWAKMWRRDFLLKYELFFDPELPRAQDIEHTHRALEHVTDAWYIAKPIYNHIFVQMGSNSRRYNPMFGHYYARAAQTIRDRIRQNGDDPTVLKAFYLLAGVLMIGVGPNFAFHPANPNPLGKQIADYKEVADKPAFREAAQKAELSIYPPSHTVSVWTIRHRMFWLFWLICKVRQLQMNLWK